MAETVKPVTTPAPFKFDAEKCQKHFDSILAHLQQFAGKPNMNPYLWFEKNCRVLANKFELAIKKESSLQTKELQDAILALPLNATPIVNPHLDKEPKKEEPPAPKVGSVPVSAAGLKLPEH